VLVILVVNFDGLAAIIAQMAVLLCGRSGCIGEPSKPIEAGSFTKMALRSA
jgi:hypothetical protein